MIRIIYTHICYTVQSEEFKFESRPEGTEDHGHNRVPLNWLEVRQIKERNGYRLWLLIKQLYLSS